MSPPAPRGTAWMGRKRMMRSPGELVTTKTLPPLVKGITATRRDGHHLPACELERQEAPPAVVAQVGQVGQVVGGMAST